MYAGCACKTVRSLEVWSRQGAIKIHFYLTLLYLTTIITIFHNNSTISCTTTTSCTANPRQIKQVEIELKDSQLCEESSIVWWSSAGSNFKKNWLHSTCFCLSFVSGTCCLELISWKNTRKHFADKADKSVFKGLRVQPTKYQKKIRAVKLYTVIGERWCPLRRYLPILLLLIWRLVHNQLF